MKLRPYFALWSRVWHGPKCLGSPAASWFSSEASSSPEKSSSPSLSRVMKDGPGLEHFLRGQPTTTPYVMRWDLEQPYIDANSINGHGQTVHIKTYGCQMNVNDTQIAASILTDAGYRVIDDIDNASIVLLMTCAIRDHAELKVWTKLNELASRKRSGKLGHFGLLGCMAERLKTAALQRLPSIDVIAGPDSYRHLPHLLAVNRLTGQSAVNVLLSLDETYQGVMPSRQANSPSAYVSITRGCDNMCSYCIVPYTRGRERSRPVQAIVDEVRHHIDCGVREVILLGQNVNSYRDVSEPVAKQHSQLADGFKTIYKPKVGGLGFDVLLDQVARVDPNVRIRFTSPHPKDFTDSVLEVIASHRNIARGLHLPAQSGSDQVLDRMRRGYTAQAYLNLVDRIRHWLGEDCGLSSDFITGFCGETDEDHQKTLDLVRQVRYEIAYIFAYSQRTKTHAYHRLKDDVPQEVKIERLIQLNQVYREGSLELNRSRIGTRQLILLEGTSKKSPDELYGRNEANQKVIVPRDCTAEDSSLRYTVGDFLEVQITDCTPVTLRARPIRPTTICDFYNAN